jgi:hypothetical protein
MRGNKLNRPYGKASRGEIPMTQLNFMSWRGACVKCGKMWREG